MPTKNLDEAGLSALRGVAEARTGQREARAAAEQRAKALVIEETAASEDALARAVAAAITAGVPKARIAREGLGTVDWQLVERYRERAAAVA